MISIIPLPNTIVDKNITFSIPSFRLIIPNKYKKLIKKIKDSYLHYLNEESKYYLEILNKSSLRNDEYILDIDEKRIEISASSEVGAYYALVSLVQIVQKQENYLEIQGVHISDKPHYKFRSFQLDEARHFYGKEEVKKIIDMLSFLKFNYFHWHLCDDQGFRINLKKFPKLAEVGSLRKRTKLIDESCPDYDENEYQYYYEEEDIIEIIEYAKERYISIIPEIDLPGHTGSLVASYPHLHCQGTQVEVFDGVSGYKELICVGKESTYQFLKELLTEVLNLFKDSEYFHLGGDEVIPSNWSYCPDCLSVMKRENITDIRELQTYFANRILNEVLLDSGKKIIMWHDGIKDETNKEVILQYFTWQMDEKAISKINNQRPTIYSPCSQLYFDSAYAELPLKLTYNRGVVLKGLNRLGYGSIKGFECCVWTEFIRDIPMLEFMILPRLHAVSESCWTHKKNRDYASFIKRLDYHYDYMKNNGYICASKKIIDIDDKDSEISRTFRHVDRLVEMKIDKLK